MTDDPLFPYQHIGAHFLWKHKYALLADEMGLGKSCQAIRGADLAHADRILIVCPAVARANWEREFKTFSVVARTIKVLFDGKQTITNTDAVIVCSYDLLEHYLPQLSTIRWDVAVADEAHFIKNRKAGRTQALLRVAKSARQVWFLSGTPAPNNCTELWPMLYFMGATKLDYWQFVDRYAVTKSHPIYGVRVIGNNKNTIPELKAILKDIMLRRRKEDVLKDLPPIFYQEVAVEARPFDEQLFFFDHMGRLDPKLQETLAEQRKLAEMLTVNGVGNEGLAALEAAKSPLSTLRRYTGMQKTAAITEMVKEELDSGEIEKIVIFAIHQNVIETFRTSLRDYKPVTIYGGTPADKRDKHVQTFQTNPKCRVFIGQIVAAGTAITLTAAHHVLFAEASWVPAENAQAAMRCHRIGQTKPVTVRFAYIPKSIDEAVTRTVKRKTKELSDLFD